MADIKAVNQHIETLTELSEMLVEVKRFCVANAERDGIDAHTKNTLTATWDNISRLQSVINQDIKSVQRVAKKLPCAICGRVDDNHLFDKRHSQ